LPNAALKISRAARLTEFVKTAHLARCRGQRDHACLNRAPQRRWGPDESGGAGQSPAVDAWAERLRDNLAKVREIVYRAFGAKDSRERRKIFFRPYYKIFCAPLIKQS
jgi:hypothetical protein